MSVQDINKKAEESGKSFAETLTNSNNESEALLASLAFIIGGLIIFREYLEQLINDKD